MPTITSCKDCFGTKYQKGKCAYERAVDYAETYKYYKEKWNEEFPDLLEKAKEMGPETMACKVERNASMPLLQQQEFMAQMDDRIKRLTEAIEKIVGKPAKEPKPASANQKKMWRPDIKEEKVPEAIALLKAKYPSLIDNDIEITKNKNNNSTIRFQPPA
jgi:hypothetical protein